MRIKKYTAPSMKEALLQIKQELGENAMILKTRKLPRKLFALGAADEVEVTAAIDDAAPGGSSLGPLKVDAPGLYGRTGTRVEAAGVAARDLPAAPAAPVPGRASPREASSAAVDRLSLLGIREDIRELKDLMKSILQTGETAAAGGFAGAWAVLYKRLTDAEVSPALAEELIQALRNGRETPDKDINKRFIKVLSDRFPVAGAIGEPAGARPRIVAFVGPTGAGKTTTLAKLAAHYSLSRRVTTSIVTADTYRIAAIEQIRTFADIVGVGLQVIFSPEESGAALEACENDDYVFIDTAGRSQRNREHMRDLEQFLEALKPDETHLVLSAATKESDLGDTIKRYRGLGVDRLLFTKLDETVRLGNVFNVVSRGGIGVSYFTFGQSVPDDIELAQPGRFVQRLWEGSSV